ncbi:MAG TPA: hypothetical protein VHQ45_17485 [Gemmatimonadaceae bacterium]|jgi:mannose/fructose-specific phosphotransferase system component IIA|nr:hypothetical protein [Gemmatimonadaceae bacterium]
MNSAGGTDGARDGRRASEERGSAAEEVADEGADGARGPVRAVVAGHADFATGMISAVALITGRADAYVAMSNRDLGADEIERRMRAIVRESGARVVFTDLPGGSCTLAARRVARDMPELTVVTGVNLAVLLDFVFHDEASGEDAASAAVRRGRDALLVFGGAGGR